jgi:hypothetical protein
VVKKILAGAVGGAAALAVIFGAGPAVADNEYKGLTYAKVQERTGNRAVISSRTGSYLPTEECIVTGNRRASFLDSSGNGNAKILVDLNCNDTMTAGHPGYSVATDQGKKAQQLKETGVNLSKNYTNALKADKAPRCEEIYQRCQDICQQAGTCSEELLEYLGL